MTVWPGDDNSIALQELAVLKRGKNQTAKELADSAQRLASRAYYSNDYASQEKAALHMFQKAVGRNSSSNVLRGGAKTLEMAMETVEIQERYTRKAIRATQTEENETATYLKIMGNKLEALLGERTKEAMGCPTGVHEEEESRHGMSRLSSKGALCERVSKHFIHTISRRRRSRRWAQ